MRQIILIGILFTSLCSLAQQTYVPDDNFENYLENNGMGNGIPGDDYVTTANISGVSSLIIWGWNIADLTGIEDFSSLSQLFCFDNQLTSLNVTQNPFLSDLRCYNNQLTSLDISQNGNLTQLFCDNNNLTSLDCSQNPILNDLRCFSNNLTSLNVTQNPNLQTLICYDNNLSSLDVTQNPNLTNFRCYNNNLNALDVTNNTQLSDFRCYDNNLTTLDVSQNTALTILFCYQNDLTDLDVTNNTALTDLRCFFNDITALDISNSLGLITLMCNDNQLVCLNANNGQNLYLLCTNNNLDCIAIANPSWAYVNATYDAGITFQISCETVLNNDVIQFETTLTAEQGGATYQWLDCNITDGVIFGETNQSYTPTTTGYYAVEITYTHPCGGTQIDTSSCHYVDYSGIEELTLNGKAELVKITDLMGRETPYKPNTVLIYVYSDGTIRRVFDLK